MSARTPFELGRVFATRYDQLPSIEARMARLGSLIAAREFGNGFNAAMMEWGLVDLMDWRGEGDGPDEVWWR